MSLPNEVKTLLTWWYPRVQGILGASRIRSVIIGGGLALQDFAPAWSDVDTCVVLTAAVSENEGAMLESLHNEMADRFLDPNEDSWRSHTLMDAIYIPHEMTSDPMRHWRYYSVRTVSGMFVERNISGFARYIMHQFPLYYYGNDVEIVMPTRDNLVSQLNLLLSRMTSPPLDREDNAIWFAMKIFDIGRSVVFWRDGVLMSKTAAMKHEIDLKGPFTDSYRLALACREKGKAFAEVHLSDLSRCFESIREPAVDLLKQLSAQNDS